jgi:putative DNA primase/helicase
MDDRTTHNDSETGSNGIPALPQAQWLEPQGLIAKLEGQPYPLEALPGVIRRAVDEVQTFVQAPTALVATCALGAVATVCQGHYDVERADRLRGPISLFTLVIAVSGERKSSVDKFFTRAILQHEHDAAIDAKPEIARHKAALASWEAKRKGLLHRIEADQKSGKSSDRLERELAELEADKPEAPLVPRYVRQDTTPEALAYNLAKSWPSGSVVSAEAGIIFGSHAMGRDCAMRNMAQLNQLWDGGRLDVDRRTSESFSVKCARLSMSLQIQEATLREFLMQSRGLARGTGFLARFMVAWPESTQGTRKFREAPTSWAGLGAFDRRIEGILRPPLPLNDDNELEPDVLRLDRDAKLAWIAFHDSVESELAQGGEYYDIQDTAAKAADNVARLAALFHVFENDAKGPIPAEYIERAGMIMRWHLNEARRFFGELALPDELVNAVKLDAWLLEHCRKNQTCSINKNHVRRFGPIRQGDKLDYALSELYDLDRLRISRFGKRIEIEINPALVATATFATFATERSSGAINGSKSSNCSSSKPPEINLTNPVIYADDVGWQTTTAMVARLDWRRPGACR